MQLEYILSHENVFKIFLN